MSDARIKPRVRAAFTCALSLFCALNAATPVAALSEIPVPQAAEESELDLTSAEPDEAQQGEAAVTDEDVAEASAVPEDESVQEDAVADEQPDASEASPVAEALPAQQQEGAVLVDQADAPVCKLASTGNEYSTLQAAHQAINYRQGSDTVILLRDTNEQVDWFRNATIDLNGHTFSGKITAKNGTLTIKNGTINSSFEAAITATKYDAGAVGTVVLGENLTMRCSSTALSAINGGQIIVDGATVVCTDENHNAVEVSGSYNGNTGKNSCVEVKRGSITQTGSNMATMSVRNGAKIIISGGTVHSGSSSALAAHGNGSTITIKGGEVTNTGTDQDGNTGTNGAWVGYASEEGKIVVESGTVRSEKGNGLYAYNSDKADAHRGTIEVSGGTVSAVNGYALLACGGKCAVSVSGGSLEGKVRCGTSANGSNDTFTISGGTVSGEVECEGEGCTLTATGGTYTCGIDDAYVAKGFSKVSTENPWNPDEVKVIKGIAIKGSVSMQGWTYGDAAKDPVLAEGSNPGNATVTYEYKAKGTADSTYTTKKPTTAGTYIVRASVAAIGDYLAGVYTAEFTIAKHGNTPMVVMDSWTYGQQAKNPSVLAFSNPENAPVTYEYKAKGADDATYTQNKPTKGGSYVVRATVAESANYKSGSATTEFDIRKVPLTIKANDVTMTYGDKFAPNGMTFSGFVAGENESSLEGEPGYGTAGTTWHVGTYSLTPGGYTSPNYDITYVDGTITVNPRVLQLSWSVRSGTIFLCDGLMKAVTPTVSNAVNGDKLTLTYEGNSATDPGDYEARVTGVSGLMAPNYMIAESEPTTRLAWKIRDVTAPEIPDFPGIVTKDTLVYNGKPQELVFVDESLLPEGYTDVEYTLNGKTWSDQIPAPTKAGTYTVGVRYVGEEGYDDVAVPPVTVTIYRSAADIGGASGEPNSNSSASASNAASTSKTTASTSKTSASASKATLAKTGDVAPLFGGCLAAVLGSALLALGILRRS